MTKANTTSKEAANNNFKVFKTGGKQYIATPGLKIRIEKIIGEYKEGDTITFDEVLMSSEGGKVEVGMPTIAGANVMAKLLEIGRDEKKLVVKYKAKSRYYKKNGHRQPRFIVEII